MHWTQVQEEKDRELGSIRPKRFEDLSRLEKERLREALARLADDPYSPRSGADIKKLRGKRHDMYRLRVGNHRFEHSKIRDLLRCRRPAVFETL